MAEQEKLKVKTTIIHRFYHNPEWKIFLDNLPSQQAKDTACLVMNWVKETYPQLAETLNGELKHEEINEEEQ